MNAARTYYMLVIKAIHFYLRSQRFLQGWFGACSGTGKLKQRGSKYPVSSYPVRNIVEEEHLVSAYSTAVRIHYVS